MTKMKVNNNIWQGNKDKHTSINPLIKVLMNKYYSDLLKLVKSVNPKKILDAGCGEGFIADKMKNMMPQAIIEGVDIEDSYLEYGKSHFKKLILKKGSLYDIPSEDNTFDLVTCNEVLEHLEYPEKVVKEIVRVSSNYVIISVPNEPYWRIANVLRLKYLRDLGNSPGHLNNWTKHKIVIFLTRYGKIEKVKNSTLWTFVLLSKFK